MLVKMIVDPSQAAFIPNRNMNIAENMPLAQEVVHTFTHSKKEEVYGVETRLPKGLQLNGVLY